MKTNLTIRKISFVAIYLAILIVSKVIFGVVQGVEIVTSLVIFGAMIFELPIYLLMISSFNFLTGIIYGFGSWWIVYWPMYFSIGLLSYFFKNKIQKNVAIYSGWVGFFAFTIFVWYFFHDLILFDMEYAVALLSTSMIPNAIGGFVNIAFSALLFWTIGTFKQMYIGNSNLKFN